MTTHTARRSPESAVELLERRQMLTAAVPLLAPPGPGAGTGLTGEYFDGGTTTGVTSTLTPRVVRTDGAVKFRWNSGRPEQAVSDNGFTVQWTGQVRAPATGQYTFETVANGGTRVTVDGTIVLDTLGGPPSSKASTTGTISLVAGQRYAIAVEYTRPSFATPAIAGVRRATDAPSTVALLWTVPGGGRSVIAPRYLYPDATVALPSNGALTGTYYTGAAFQQPVLTRADPAINYDFDTGTPDPTIPLGLPFSVVWTGRLTPTTTAAYTFSAVTDDGVRLYVDGQTVINNWRVHSATLSRGTINLTAGQTYAVTMQYYQDGVGHGVAKLFDATPGTAAAIVQFDGPVTPVATAPGALTGLTATPGAASIALAWTPTPNATSYTVARSTDGTTFATLATGDTTDTYTDATAVPGTAYVYRVTPVNAVGTGTPGTVSATLGAGTVPVTSATAVASGTSTADVRVNWTAVTGATGYIVQRSADGTTFANVGATVAAGTTTLTDTGLAFATPYYYRVIATTAAGNSNASNVATVTTVPAAPVNLTAAVFSDSQINLTWTDVTGETGYTVQESTSPTTGFATIGQTAANVTALPVGNLAANTTYYFRVLANDGGGSSDPSNVANGTTTAATPAFATQMVIYGLTNGGNVYSIDTATGAATNIGTLAFGTQAAGRDPVSGDFFYVGQSTATPTIGVWHPATGANRTLATAPTLVGPVTRATFRDTGALYVTGGPADLYQIDATTGAATLKGVLTVAGTPLTDNTGDMAFAPDGTLYVESGTNLYKVALSAIDAAAGGAIATTYVGPNGSGTESLQIAFGQNGSLYATGTTSGILFQINTSTGAALQVAGSTTSGIALGDLASVPLNANLVVNQAATALVRGSTATYTVRIANNGPDETDGPVTVTDTLPAGLTFVSGSGDGWTVSVTGQAVTLTYASNLTANTAPPAVTVVVNVTAAAPASLTNTVVVNSTVFDPDVTDNAFALTSSVTG